MQEIDKTLTNLPFKRNKGLAQTGKPLAIVLVPKAGLKPAQACAYESINLVGDLQVKLSQCIPNGWSTLSQRKQG